MVSRHLFNVLFCLAATCVGITQTDQNIGEHCCAKLDIPYKCHFLCDVFEESYWSLNRWKCTHKYLAKVTMCKTSSAIDLVKAFGNRFTQTVSKKFNKLSNDLKAKLTDAKTFAQITLEQIKGISQDILGALQDSLNSMTNGQFGALVSRLKSFTAMNLRQFMDKVNVDAFVSNLSGLNAEDFDPEQLAALAQTAIRKWGEDVKQWTASTLSKLKKVLAGLDTSRLVQISGTAFRDSVDSFCSVEFSNDQKQALMTPAQKAYGDLSQWNKDALEKMCKLLESLPVEDILKLSSDAVDGAIQSLANLEFKPDQLRALVIKLEEKLGDVKDWSTPNLQKLDKILKGLKVNEIAKIAKEKIKAILKNLGKHKWEYSQLRQLAKKVILALGDPNTFTDQNLKDMKNILVGLLPSELKQIGNQTLTNVIGYIKDVEVQIDQAIIMAVKIKDRLNVKNFDKDDVVAIANILDGFLSSDIGQMSQVAVFAAFPELLPVKQVATPILRALVNKYKQQSGNKNIGVLGSIAYALTRSELDNISPEEIVNQLDEVNALPWDKGQILKLMSKVRQKWGDFNGTDADDSDSPTWGFKNFRRLKKVVLGIAKEELRALPIRGIENVVEAIGKQSGWQRGQIVAVTQRLREFWEMENVGFSNFTELDINMLGHFIQGLSEEDLNKLPESILHIAIKRLGEKTGLPEDKLKSRAYMAIQFFKKQTGVDVLNATQVHDLGSLVAGMSRETYRKFTKNAFINNLYNIAHSDGMTKDKLEEIASLAKKHFEQSDAGKWLLDQWKDLGPAIKGLSASDFLRITQESFEEIIDDAGMMEGFSKDQARALIQKAKEYWQEKDVSKWTGEHLRRIGSLVKGLHWNEIMKIDEEQFKDAMAVWGQNLDLDRDTLRALAAKVNKLFDNDLSRLVAEDVKQLGRIMSGFTPENLEKLNLINIDMLAELGKWKDWSKEQLEKLRPKIMEFLAKFPSDENYMSLGELAPVLSEQHIKDMSSQAFRLSAQKLSSASHWNSAQIKSLADKAKTAWSQGAELWDSSQVSELGKIVGGLSGSDLSKLKPEVMDQINPQVLTGMSSGQLKSFSVQQFEALESPQAHALYSNAKFSQLSSEQKDAIKNVIKTDPQDPDPWEKKCSGATCSGVSSITGNIWITGVLLAGTVLFRQLV